MYTRTRAHTHSIYISFPDPPLTVRGIALFIYLITDRGSKGSKGFKWLFAIQTGEMLQMAHHPSPWSQLTLCSPIQPALNQSVWTALRWIGNQVVKSQTEIRVLEQPRLWEGARSHEQTDGQPRTRKQRPVCFENTYKGCFQGEGWTIKHTIYSTCSQLECATRLFHLSLFNRFSIIRKKDETGIKWVINKCHLLKPP